MNYLLLYGIITKTNAKVMPMINILITLNHDYIAPLKVMMQSLCENNKNCHFRIFVVHSSLTSADFEKINAGIPSERCEIVDIFVPYDRFPDLPYSQQWPKEACYRIFAAHILPGDLERVLYLDPDIVVINNIEQLYTVDMEDNYFAACTHLFEPVQSVVRRRLKMAQGSVYVNSGMMLINLKQLREEQNIGEVYEYIKKNRKKLHLFDQDTLNGLYSEKIIPLNPLLYNLDEKYFNTYRMKPNSKPNKIDREWVLKNTVIIHFCGKRKPWKENYRGAFGGYYNEYAEKCRLAEAGKRL